MDQPKIDSASPFRTLPAYPQTAEEAPPERSGTNGFAIAALVTGVCGGVVLSVILAVVAVNQADARNQNGKRMAIAGAIASVWPIVVFFLFVLLSS